MMSFVTEATVPSGDWPGAQKKCLALMLPAAAPPLAMTAAVTTAANAKVARTATAERAAPMIFTSRLDEPRSPIEVRLCPQSPVQKQIDQSINGRGLAGD